MNKVALDKLDNCGTLEKELWAWEEVTHGRKLIMKELECNSPLTKNSQERRISGGRSQSGL